MYFGNTLWEKESVGRGMDWSEKWEKRGKENEIGQTNRENRLGYNV